MKYSVSYEIKKNDFPKIAARLPQAAADVQGRAVFMLVQAADPNTPVATGNLKNAKTIDPGGIGKPGFVHWHAPYTAYVHNGTRYMAGRPFIANAVQQVWPIYQEAMQALAKGQGL